MLSLTLLLNVLKGEVATQLTEQKETSNLGVKGEVPAWEVGVRDDEKYDSQSQVGMGRKRENCKFKRKNTKMQELPVLRKRQELKE